MEIGSPEIIKNIPGRGKVMETGNKTQNPTSIFLELQKESRQNRSRGGDTKNSKQLRARLLFKGFLGINKKKAGGNR